MVRGALLIGGAALTCVARAGVSLQWDINSSLPGAQGGIGVWNTSAANWLDAGGSNVGWNNAHNDIAVFSGTPAAQVTILSAVTADAIQIDTLNYVLGQTNNSTITLSSGSLIANVDALIRAPLASSVKLVKSGAGVLSISGTSTLGGGISITAGTLSFTNDYSLGGATNVVSLDGGNLRYTGSGEWTTATSRQINVSASGGGIDAVSTMGLRRTGNLIGGGVLTKLGAGNLVISDVNAGFSGSVKVLEGTLTLSNPGAINLRPVTLSGGSMLLMDDGGSTFSTAVSVAADSSLSITRMSPWGGTAHVNADVGNLSVAALNTLTVSGSNRLGIGISNLQLDGVIAIRDTGLTVKGLTSGAGEVRFFPLAAPVGPVNYGLVFDGGLARTARYAITADDASGASAVVTVAAGSIVNFAGNWNVGGTNSQSFLLLRDGGKFVFTGSSRANTLIANGTSSRPFTVMGIGASNVVELDGAFVADHSAGGAIADGLAGLVIQDATLVSRSTGALPVVTKADGFGGTHRAGALTFSGTAGSTWVVATAAQQYDGGVSFSSNATVQTDTDLTHIGTTAAKFDGQFQIPVAATLRKTGAGWLVLSGQQGFAPGSAMVIASGGLRFMTDPGMGFYSGNYTRGGDGNVATAPVAAGTLAVSVGGSGAASVEFAGTVSRVASLEVKAGGTARVTLSTPGEKALVVNALTLSGGTIDLTHQRMVIDYSGSNTVLANIRAGLASGAIGSSLTQSDPTLVVGYAEASKALRISGTQTASFGPVNVDATSIVLRATRVGDANLDGKVSFGDFQKLEVNFGLPGTWYNGDFDYDGVVTFNDFALLFANYGQGLGQPSLPVSEGEAQSLAMFGASVPEPGALLWALATALVCRRRRRGLHSASG